MGHRRETTLAVRSVRRVRLVTLTGVAAQVREVFPAEVWLDRRQRYPDRGARRDAAAVAGRCFGTDLGQFLERACRIVFHSGTARSASAAP